MLSVDGIRPNTIIGGKMGQNDKRAKCAIFFRLAVLSWLEPNYDLYCIQLAIVLKVLLVKSHVKINVSILKFKVPNFT